LSHVGVAFSKTGILILGATFKANVGYPSYNTIQKQDYPKSYCPNRFHGFIDKNAGATDFDDEEISQIAEAVRSIL
jgi:hypothetical protein